MNNNILLVSENTVRKNSSISTNVQSHYLISAIQEAHLDLELVIGSKLLTYIQSLIADELIDTEECVDYKNLLNQIKYYLINMAVYHLCDIVSIKIDNMGMVQANDEHVQNVSINDAEKIKNQFLMKAERYLKRLEMFIYENWTVYKDYLTVDKYDEFAPNIYSASDTPIYLGGARGKGWWNYRSLKDKYENKYYNNYFRY